MRRNHLKLQKEIYLTIEKNPNITMSQLERRVGTNPASLKEHCLALQELGLIKIKKTDKTTKLKIKHFL